MHGTWYHYHELARRGREAVKMNGGATTMAIERQREKEHNARAENNAARKADDAARAQRLQADWAVAMGLRSLLQDATAYARTVDGVSKGYITEVEVMDAWLSGRLVNRYGPVVGTTDRLKAQLVAFDYLNAVPREAFDVRL